MFGVGTKWNYLVPADGQRSVRLALFGVVTKRNKLVTFARTAFSAVYIVESQNEVELTCSVRMDYIQHGSHC